MKVVTLCSGSKGNSSYIEINNKKILIDTGKNVKYISESLKSIGVDLSDIHYIFITHTHSDHVSALKNVLRKSNAILCITNKLFLNLNDLKDFDRLLIFEDEIELNDITFIALKSSHDSEDSRNYVIEFDNKKIVLITDTGYVKQKHFKIMKNADIILIESNHDIELLQNGRYPDWLKKRVVGDEGHLSNNQAGFYLSKIIGDKTKHILLIHLSEDNNEPEVALNTVNNILNEYDISFNNINYARQNELSEVMEV